MKPALLKSSSALNLTERFPNSFSRSPTKVFLMLSYAGHSQNTCTTLSHSSPHNLQCRSSFVLLCLPNSSLVMVIVLTKVVRGFDYMLIRTEINRDTFRTRDSMATVLSTVKTVRTAITWSLESTGMPSVRHWRTSPNLQSY